MKKREAFGYGEVFYLTRSMSVDSRVDNSCLHGSCMMYDVSIFM